MEASESPTPKASTPAYKLIFGKPMPQEGGGGGGENEIMSSTQSMLLEGKFEEVLTATSLATPASVMCLQCL